MKRYRSAFAQITSADIIRKLLFGWLSAAVIEYILLPAQEKDLSVLNGLANMSFPRLLITALLVFAFFCAVDRPVLERWGIICAFTLLSAVSLWYNFTWYFLGICLLLLLCLVVYGIKGWNGTAALRAEKTKKHIGVYHYMTAAAAAAFLLFVSVWTVCRVKSFSTPSYDFGIFSQMFYSMKTTGLPMTTLERDGLLSHFYVHVSPVYYSLLPVYYLFPFPATLQVLQAAVLASAVIPLWKLGRKYDLSAGICGLLCVLLLLYPAYSGGASYDIHENAFLTPCVLWLLYGLERKHIPGTLISLLLVLSIKEDAAVYAAVIALYFLLRGILQKDKWYVLVGTLCLGASVAWFILVTDFLASTGDGVMTYRYRNFMYDGSQSLTSVIKAVLLCPAKAIYECVDREKIQFILLTLLPFGGLMFFTRRYERFVLLIPYILINLMSDYQYQHNIFFQYTYGATACLVYLIVVNLSDFRSDSRRYFAVSMACMIGLFTFITQCWPKADSYAMRYTQNSEHYASVEAMLDLIPEDASVTATTFYTTYLSQRDILYDVQYTTSEHMLSTEYIVLSLSSDSAYTKYATESQSGLDALSDFLQSEGYVPYAELEGTLLILKKE